MHGGRGCAATGLDGGGRGQWPWTWTAEDVAVRPRAWTAEDMAVRPGTAGGHLALKSRGRDFPSIPQRGCGGCGPADTGFRP